MSHVEHINPRMLSWARETSGLSVPAAAEKLGLKDSAQASASEKLLALEAGRRPVSQTRLQKAASVYHRPLITFYLAEPPRRGDRGEDFRTVTTGVATADNFVLDTLLRDIRARQQMLREVLESLEEAKLLTFVASARIESGATRVAASIRETLGVSIESQQRASNPGTLFSLLRTAAERVGIFVLLLGDIGSYHSDIGEDVFRGFAISDDEAPIVVINDNDAVTARGFTLVHELAHIWLGATGVSGAPDLASANTVERFCNDVAGEFFLPSGLVIDLSRLRGADINSILREISVLAERWNVSQAAVAYRLARNQWIDGATASLLFGMFRERWLREKQRIRDTRGDDESGPSYFVVRRSRLGAGLLDVVRRALRGEVLTHTKAAKILGVRPSSVEPLLREHPRAGATRAP